MTETTRKLNPDPGTAYSQCVPPRKARRGVRQHTVGVDDELWDDCTLIAKERRETLSSVLRARLVEYRDANQAVLDRLKIDDQNGAADPEPAAGD